MRQPCSPLAAAVSGLALGLGLLAPAACAPDEITAVGGPGGVYQPGQGCTLSEASGDCPPPAGSGWKPQLRFEALTNAGLTVDTPERVSDAHVTCQRSYCGTGALVAHADLTWDEAISSDPRRMATFSHAFDPPLDLYGRTVSFSVLIEGPKVPMHAQVGVVSDYWHWVGWAPLPAGWNRISGVVSPDNALTKLDPGVTSVPVRSLQIDVYVPTADASGATGSWSGTIYLDDVGWQ